MPIRVRVRLFAIQRELAGAREVRLELADGADVEAAWTALVARHPVLAPGRASLRFARNGDYADAATAARRRRRGRDDPAGIGRRRRGPRADGHGGSGSSSFARRRSARRSWPSSTDALATDEDGAVVGFIGRTRSTPGTPAPGQEAEAARHAGRRVEALEYEAHETMAIRVSTAIADEIAARFGVDRLAIVHRTGEVPLGEVVRSRSWPWRLTVTRRSEAARYAIDETKARAPIWKAEHFADGHVWIGQQARTGPEPDA